MRCFLSSCSSSPCLLLNMRDHVFILFFQGGRSLSWSACEVPPQSFHMQINNISPPTSPHGALKWTCSGSSAPKQNLLVQCSWLTWPPGPFSHYSAPWPWLALTQLMASGSRVCWLNQTQEPECLPFCLRNMKNNVDSLVWSNKLYVKTSHHLISTAQKLV